MVLSRNVLCVLSTWTSYSPIARVMRDFPDYEVDDLSSKFEPDPRAMGAFEAAADRGKPSLLREDRAAILAHRSSIYLTSPRLPAESAQEQAIRALTLITKLFEAGASAIKGDSSGVAHGAAHWKSLARRAATAHARGNKLERASALYAAWVRRPIREKDLLYSCGMHLLGERDLELGPGEHKNDDLGWMDLLGLYLLAEKPGRGLSDGESFRQRPDGEHRILRLITCERYKPDDFAYNPYGYWQLERP